MRGVRAAGPAAEPPKRAEPVCPPGGRAACGPMPGFCREWTRTERGMCRAQRTVGGWYRPEL